VEGIGVPQLSETALPKALETIQEFAF
jgi:hypothetical protein